MFIVDLNEPRKTIEVKTNSSIVAQGNFDVDVPDRTALIIFKHLQLAPEDHEKLDQFLSSVFTQVGQLIRTLICLRLPAIFDGRIDLDKLKFENKVAPLMSVILDHLKYHPETNFQGKEKEYQFFTEKALILSRAEELTKMMSRETFWAKKWTVEDTRDRIHSVTYVMMIVDRRTNLPCGFGRLFLLRTNEEVFRYFSDVVIDTSHRQSDCYFCQ